MSRLISRSALVAALGIFAGLGIACSGEDLTQDVEIAYKPCTEGEITMLTAKHAIQTVFGVCGANNFLYFAWAPNGIDFYFQLPYSTHVMNAEDKKVRVVPVRDAVGGAAWLSDALLVIPTQDSATPGPARLSLYNRGQSTLTDLEIPQTEPADLQPSGSTDTVLYTALDEAKVRHTYRANFTTGVIERAFPWMDALLGDAALGSFTYTPALDLVAFSDGKSTTIANGADGSVWLRIANASRAVVHPEGRYVAIETLGPPISPFDQSTWEALSPEERKKREAESKAWLERQRDWVPREVQPPVLEIYDAKTAKRARFTAFYGDRFQWYTTPYYASFVLWGLEGKEVNRNVALLDLSERMAMIAADTPTIGVELSSDAVEVVTPRK